MVLMSTPSTSKRMVSKGVGNCRSGRFQITGVSIGSPFINNKYRYRAHYKAPTYIVSPKSANWKRYIWSVEELLVYKIAPPQFVVPKWRGRPPKVARTATTSQWSPTKKG